MSNWRDIPMPPLVAERPRDVRGFPILFTSYIAPDGTPDFRGSEPARYLQCFHERRCGICGEVMQGTMVFISGPQGITNRCFGDPPMHWPCADYARQVCPFLATRRGRQLHTGDQIKGAIVAADSTGIEEKADYYGLYMARDYIGCRTPENSVLFYAGPPANVVWYNQATQRREAPKPPPRVRAEWPPRELWVLPRWRAKEPIKGPVAR